MGLFSLVEEAISSLSGVAHLQSLPRAHERLWPEPGTRVLKAFCSSAGTLERHAASVSPQAWVWTTNGGGETLTLETAQ